ncbi:MAG: hypothetical protein GY792_10730 [Gammaproteobacteria bacterium]|nr:hypothetical protein [Gammaproteobacteria bacterium]
MKTRLLRPIYLLPTLLLLFIGGCQTLENKKSDIALENVLSSYRVAVRWGNPDKAYVFLKPENLSEEGIPSGLDNIRVTGYEVIRPAVPLSEGVVTQTARISYVLEDRQVERNLVDTQIWEYQSEQKLWYRINPIPEFE